MLNLKYIQKDEKKRVWYNIRGNKLIKTTYDPVNNTYTTEEMNWN